MAYVPKKPLNKKEREAQAEKQQEEVRRIRMPQAPDVLGVLTERLGASRLRVKCLDGKSRVCRIPGKLKRRLWVRAGDIVIVKPWEFGGDAKGDVVYKYTKSQAEYIRKSGKLQTLEDNDEF